MVVVGFRFPLSRAHLWTACVHVAANTTQLQIDQTVLGTTLDVTAVETPALGASKVREGQDPPSRPNNHTNASSLLLL